LESISQDFKDICSQFKKEGETVYQEQARRYFQDADWLTQELRHYMREVILLLDMPHARPRPVN